MMHFVHVFTYERNVSILYHKCIICPQFVSEKEMGKKYMLQKSAQFRTIKLRLLNGIAYFNHVGYTFLMCVIDTFFNAS